MAKELTGLSEMHLFRNLLTSFECFDSIQDQKHLKSCFAMSFIWGVFGTISEVYQSKIDYLLKKQFDFLPQADSVFKLYLEGSTFKAWPSTLQNSVLDGELVITQDVQKYRHLIEFYLKNPSTLLNLSGPPTCGKSLILRHFFLASKSSNGHCTSFKTPSSVKSLSHELLSKMETFRKREIVPKNMNEEFRVLVDDISMDTDYARLEFVRSVHEKQSIIDQQSLDKKVIKGLRFALVGNMPPHKLIRHTTLIRLEFPAHYLESVWERVVHSSLTSDLKKHSATILTSCLQFHNSMLEQNPNVFFTSDLKKLLTSFKKLHLRDVEQTKRFLFHSMERIYTPRLLGATLPSLDDNLFLTKGPHTFSSLRNGQMEEIKDRKNLINLVNERISNDTSNSIEFVILDYTLEHVIRLEHTLRNSHSFLVGGVNEGRSNVLKIAACLADYVIC